MKNKAITHHHPDVILFVSIDLNCVVNDQIHELIKSTKCANDNTVCIQLDWPKLRRELVGE
jgi:hypothetical protein